VVSGFRCEVVENCALQGYYAARSGNFLSNYQFSLGNNPDERSSQSMCLFHNLFKFIQLFNVYENWTGDSTGNICLHTTSYTSTYRYLIFSWTSRLFLGPALPPIHGHIGLFSLWGGGGENLP